MPVSLPPLNALRAFEASARLQSFRKASEELFVTPSAVSQQIKTLEDFLELRLFDRTPKGIALTRAGKRLLPVLETAFQDIASAVEHLKSDNRIPFRISAPPVFSSTWLGPRLAQFERTNPELAVSVHSSLDVVDFDSGEYDCAVRLYPEQSRTFEQDTGGITRHFLFDVELFCVCNPERINSKSGSKRLPETVQDIHDFHLLHFRDYAPWTIWSRYFGDNTLDTTQGVVAHSVDALIRAIVNGEGIALVDRTILYDPDFGRHMAPLFIDEVTYHIYFYLVGKAERWEEKTQVLFREWLLKHVAQMDGYYAFN